jgi:PAS domain S-box-containing protein
MQIKNVRKNIFFLAVPTIVVMIIAATLFWLFNRIQEADKMRSQVELTINTSKSMLVSLVTAETAVRGYILNDFEPTLRPYYSARANTFDLLLQLRDMSKTPNAADQMSIVTRLVDQKLTRMAFTLQLKENSEIEVLMTRLRSGDGTMLMDSIRTELDKYTQLQTTQLDYYTNQFRINMQLLFYFIVCTSFFMLLFAQGFTYGIYRNIRLRIMNLMHRKTRSSLATQEAVNQQLNLAYIALRDSEKKLDVNERHLRAVIDALPVAIYTTDAEGALTHYNQAAVEFSGRTPELGSDHWCVNLKLLRTDGSYLPHDQCPMATALREKRQILGAEAIAERPDGTQIWFNAYPTPLFNTDGDLVGGINMLVDITERKQLDRVILENNIELKKAKHLADKANLAKSDFLSNMSHELRTPLSAILGFAQLIEAGTPALTSNQKRNVEQILQAGWYLLHLINEILDLTLVESGKLSLSMEPVSLNQLLYECKDMIEPQAIARNITLDFPVLNNSLFVNADQTRLKQIFINLLSNAVKYNRENGKVIVTCAKPSGQQIRICVEDTGAGITPENMTQLFQPFNRLGKENGPEEGTGIGLVMTKRLVELMGSKINVNSNVGEGSTFWFELDLVEENNNQDKNNLAKNDDTLPQMSSNADKRTLLYVEDNPANLILVEEIMASQPHITLLTARDGYEGIEIARLTQPDLILMDINLPGISGIEVMKILAKDKVTTHIPVIALSANANPRDIEKGLQAGFFRYVTKPIKINELMYTVGLALNERYE